MWISNELYNAYEIMKFLLIFKCYYAIMICVKFYRCILTGSYNICKFFHEYFWHNIVVFQAGYIHIKFFCEHSKYEGACRLFMCWRDISIWKFQILDFDVMKLLFEQINLVLDFSNRIVFLLILELSIQY